ncbi:hypothetical protein KFU94_00785 [Chloroflexi bacterium TSY]|nr:hypothetical protein [Chloroflexi bacterium TSY]
MYYRATELEVQTVLECVVKRYPELKSRAVKAADILLRDCLEFNHERGQWRCWSLTDPRHSYYVAATCTCPDHQSQNCPVIRGRKYCKHRLAALAYQHILRGHLNARMCGSLAFITDRTKARSHSNELLLLDSKTSHAVVYANRLDKIPTDICQIKWVMQSTHFVTGDDNHDFRDDKDAAAFAQWLYNAFPIREYYIDGEDQQTYAMMRQAGFSHSLALIAAEQTGEVDERFDFPNPATFAAAPTGPQPRLARSAA